jgi:osmotically-inducible protein OsmY
MPFEHKVPDKALLAKVNQRLSRCGVGSRVHVNATVRNGTVTLSGVLDFDYQRKPLLRAAAGVDGVRMVIDQLKVKPPTHWSKESGRVSEVQL